MYRKKVLNKKSTFLVIFITFLKMLKSIQNNEEMYSF